MKKKFNFGKIDFDGTGKNRNLVIVEIELTDKNVFTASARIWDNLRRDIVAGGQCLDELNNYPLIRNNKEFKTIFEMWKKHHLNDMHAGTEAQEKALDEHDAVSELKLRYASNYKEACNFLEEKGLLIDNGYKYGTGWIKREIPSEDLKKIKELLK